MNPEDEAKVAKVRDKILGGPNKRIEDFARGIGVSYEELIGHAKEFVETDGNHSWNEGDRFESANLYDGFWADFELVTRIPVPSKIMKEGWGFFSCSC